MRLIQGEKLELVALETNQVGLNVEAALADDKEGDFAALSAIFEVRIGVEKVYQGISDSESGRFVARNIPVGKFGSPLDVVILGRDEGGYATFRTQLNVDDIVAQMDNKRREMEAEMARNRLLSPMEAERERQTKELIKKAFNDMQEEDTVKVEVAFGILVDNHINPLVKREIVNVARKYPDKFIQYANLYYKACWSEAVLNELAKQQPQKIIEKVKEFYEYDWAKNIVVQIAEMNPGIALSEIEYYEFMPWAEEIAIKATRLDPWAAINNYDKYRDQLWAESVVRLAREEVTKHEAWREMGRRIDAACTFFSQPHNREDEVHAFSFFVDHQHDERMEDALSVLAGYFTESFLEFHWIYKDATWGEKVFNIAKDEKERQEARKDVGQKIFDIGQLFFQPQHSEEDEINAIRFFVEHQHDDRIKRAIYDIIAKCPSAFSEHKDLYKSAIWAEEVNEFLDITEESVRWGLEKDKQNALLAIGKQMDSICQLLIQSHNEEDEISAIRFFVEHQYDDRIEAAINRLFAYDQSTFSRHIDLYKDAVWAPKIIERLAEMQKYYDEEARKEVGLKIEGHCGIFSQQHALEDEINALRFFVENQYDERIESAVGELAQLFPVSFLNNRHVYKDAIWGKKIFDLAKKTSDDNYSLWEKLANEDPVEAISRILVWHQNEGWAKYLLGTMSIKYPNGIISKKEIAKLRLRAIGLKVPEYAECLIRKNSIWESVRELFE